MLDGLFDPSWTVVFGISLSVALFCVKFAVARTPKFDDIIVGLADIPCILTASACSLLVASITYAADWRVPGARMAWLIMIFVMNVCILRFVEKRKRSLSSSKLAVAGLIAISIAISIFLSFNLVSVSYLEIGQ